MRGSTLIARKSASRFQKPEFYKKRFPVTLSATRFTATPRSLKALWRYLSFYSSKFILVQKKEYVNNFERQ